jgi:hypothetical protein
MAGTVVSATTGAPLSQARITIAETRDRGKLISMITSEDGHFEFSQLRLENIPCREQNVGSFPQRTNNMNSFLPQS